MAQVTENLGCLSTGDSDVDIDLDRKAWAGMGNTNNHSEGYFTTFDLPGDNYGPCMKITMLEVTINVSSHDYITNMPAGCNLGETWLNIYLDNSVSDSPASVPTSMPPLIYQAPENNPEDHSDITFFCTDWDMPFDGQIGIDLVPVSSIGGCTSSQSLISGNFAEIIFDICVTATIDLIGSAGIDASADNLTLCIGEDIELTESDGDNVMWDWDGPNGFTSIDQNPVITNTTAADFGTYSVTVTDGDGCTNEATVDIMNYPVPSVSATAVDTDVCIGQTIELNEGGGDATSWSWSGPNGFSSTDQDPSIPNSTSADIGTYTVTIIDGNGCMGSGDVTIDPTSSPNVNATATDLTICDNQDIELMEDAGDATSWSWTGPDGYTSTDQNPVITSSNSDNLGTYTVNIMNADGCTNSHDVTISQGPSPVADPTAVDDEICPGQDIMFDEIGGDAVSWDWSGPNGFSSSIQDPVVSNSTVADLGTYTVTVTDINGCTSSFDLPVVSGPMPSASAEADNLTVCPGDDIVLDETDGEADFWMWDGPDGFNSTLNSPTINNSTVDNLGTYTVTVTDADGCTGTDEITISAGACSCSLDDAMLSAITCNENTTPSDDTDDYISFSLNPQGTNLSSGYSITVSGGTVTPTNGSYGSPTSFQLQDGSAGGGDVVITITDNNDSNCSITVPINDPGTCSGSCSINMANLGTPTCNNGGTPNDATDDIIEFTLNPQGSNLGPSYILTVLTGTITPSTGTYSATTTLQLQNGSAGQGNVTVTITDAADPNCTIQVTITDPGICSIPFDCPVLMLNIGDACDDNNSASTNDIVLSDCTCAGEYDCPTLSLNIGDPCDDGDPATMSDVINAACDCEGFTSFDCPIEQANFGDPCDDGNPDTANDIIQPDCTCAGEYDCPTLSLNIGDPCDDGDPATMGDAINANCDCEGFTSFDCPNEQANFGDPCDDGNPDTANDVIQTDCTCAGEYDCPTLMLNIGDACDDNNPDTDIDLIQADCSCAGEYDCPVLMLNIGDPCDDGDPSTMGDAINASCDCEGFTSFDCPTEMLNFGDPCDDGNPDTANDIIQPDCSCAGEYDCPTLMLNIGDPCNDSDPNTENDQLDANCDCVGTSIFDCPNLLLNIGDTCDDQDSDTFNDQVNANCECEGAPSDCMTAVPIIEECNDQIDCTTNDTQSVLPDGTICEPCLGERITCDNGETMTTSCDDGNPLTFDDTETILVCDGSVCEPCKGTPQIIKVYIPTTFSVSETGNNEFGIFSDQEIEILHFRIYDRWGQLLFDVSNVLSSNPSAKWNGRKGNNEVNQGVYVYQLQYMLNREMISDLGQITVIR